MRIARRAHHFVLAVSSRADVAAIVLEPPALGLRACTANTCSHTPCHPLAEAAGGHNCICGLYDYVNTHFPGSKVFGFVGGPKGVMTNTYKLLDDTIIDAHRNSGGFTMLASGRDKIETPEQFEMVSRSPVPIS